MIPPDLLKGPPVTTGDLLRSAAVFVSAVHVWRSVEEAVAAVEEVRGCGR